MKQLSPFHIALPVPDIDVAINFYHHKLEMPLGRQSDTWVDINFFGHQLVFHKAPKGPELHYNDVDAHGVPVPHFGVILNKEEWRHLSTRLKEIKVEFIIEPYLRFEGQAGEQGTFFFKDPNGLALEFKTFADQSQIFES